MLEALAKRLKASLGIEQKQDIQGISNKLKELNLEHGSILVGDDCAAIPDGDGYLLFAAEGMLPSLVQTDPWFAGWCSVLVNVSDIYAMGGRPIAVVDAVWSSSQKKAEPLWDGMIAASKALNVPIVGGHTNCHSDYEAVSVAILGRSQQLISSFQAQPDDVLLLLADLNGKPYPQFSYCWDAATHASPEWVQKKLGVLPQLAEAGLCDAGKDISMGGIIGTTLMLLESSQCGAVIELDQIPVPNGIDLEQWLLSFPSFGFLLSVRPDKVDDVIALAKPLDIMGQPIGRMKCDRKLTLVQGTEQYLFWDLDHERLTGFIAEKQ